MNEQNKKQLWLEIEHIFDSGANELRVFNMVQAFIDSRYEALDKPDVIESVCEHPESDRQHYVTGPDICDLCGAEI